MEEITLDKNEKHIATRNLLEHSLLIVWKVDEYNLGIPIIDEQHRGIVTTINSLHYGMQNKHARDVLAPVVDMVTEYTRLHFILEEEFLAKYEFPTIKQHRQLHFELTTELSKVGKDSLWHQDPYEFLEFLKKWWVDHICEEDRKFHDHLLKILHDKQ